MQRFFEFLLFSEGGAYTLHGSKPMTRFEVSFYSYDELIEIHGGLEKESIVVNNYDFPENWEKWESVQSKFVTPRFILIRKQDKEYEKLSHVFFINVLEAVLVIQENYALFKTVLGYDFEPIKVVFEIQNEQSKFWDGVFTHSELSGLLYGFGYRNSMCFKWKFSEGTPEVFRSLLCSKFSDCSKCKDFTGRENIELLGLPVFASFQESDHVIEKYMEERKKIKKLYRGQDVVKIAIKHLARG
ncbi:MAG: hypothetical protein H6620_11865 [Halobacteriovoraceae bacterium]|nr:hypothetical protein [Halobacteriovoraceae bacterium]